MAHILYKPRFKGNYKVMIDTLKTTGAGMGGWWLSINGWLPEVVSLSVGITTLIYLIIKIKKELT
jgi:hypothetical protein